MPINEYLDFHGGDCTYIAGHGWQCTDGSYYDLDGVYHPVAEFCKGGGCPPGALDIFNNVRPITNTVYPNVINQTAQPNLQDWLSNLIGQKGVTAQSVNNDPGIFDTIKAHPVIALGIAAGLAYFFLGSGTGTYEQVTTKRKGF